MFLSHSLRCSDFGPRTRIWYDSWGHRNLPPCWHIEWNAEGISSQTSSEDLQNRQESADRTSGLDGYPVLVLASRFHSATDRNRWEGPRDNRPCLGSGMQGQQESLRFDGRCSSRTHRCGSPAPCPDGHSGPSQALSTILEGSACARSEEHTSE